MAAKRLLIISNELIADRPGGVPEVVRKQVRDADEVRVVVPALTERLQSWLSDIDGAIVEADTRMQDLVGDISSAHPGVHGRVGDEDPLVAGPPVGEAVGLVAPEFVGGRVDRVGEGRFGDHAAGELACE